MTVLSIVDSVPAINPDVVLEKAKGQYKKVFVIGYDNYGLMDCRASFNMDNETILLLIEQFKFNMFSGKYSNGADNEHD